MSDPPSKTPRPRTNHAGVSLAFQGRIERNGGEDLTSCSGCGSGRCDERERESLRLAPLISARRSDTRSVDLQCTRSCRHAPQCHPCARFGPFGIRHLVQPAELRLAALTGLPPSDVPEPPCSTACGRCDLPFWGSGHAPALRCARGLPLKSNGDPSATRPRMRNATRCSRGYAPLTRREVMNDESRDELPPQRAQPSYTPAVRIPTELYRPSLALLT